MTNIAYEAAKTLAPIFEANGWEWTRTTNGVPNVDEITDFIDGMITRLLDSDGEWISSGRIRVMKGKEAGSFESVVVALEIEEARI